MITTRLSIFRIVTKRSLVAAQGLNKNKESINNIKKKALF